MNIGKYRTISDLDKAVAFIEEMCAYVKTNSTRVLFRYDADFSNTVTMEMKDMGFIVYYEWIAPEYLDDPESFIPGPAIQIVSSYEFNHRELTSAGIIKPEINYSLIVFPGIDNETLLSILRSYLERETDNDVYNIVYRYQDETEQ